MTETDPNDDGSEIGDRLSDETQTNRPTAEAKRYMRRVLEQPPTYAKSRDVSSNDSPQGNQPSVTTSNAPGQQAGALLQLARDDPDSLTAFLPF